MWSLHNVSHLVLLLLLLSFFLYLYNIYVCTGGWFLGLEEEKQMQKGARYGSIE